MKQIREHALLYALIVKKLFETYEKPEAEELIRKITVTYGIRRGKRMAQLARDNGEKPDLNTFMIHGEWAGKPGENLSSTEYGQDEVTTRVSRCAWYDTWKQNGLLEYGTYYCRYIDKAICEGFAGDFELSVLKTMNEEDKECIFFYDHGADEEKVLAGKADKRWLKDFDWHCAELFESAEEVLKDQRLLAKINEEFVVYCA